MAAGGSWRYHGKAAGDGTAVGDITAAGNVAEIILQAMSLQLAAPNDVRIIVVRLLAMSVLATSLILAMSW